MKKIGIIGDGAEQVAAAVIGRIPGVEFHALETSASAAESDVREQPSPTGNDGDLQMEPPAKPRMIGGSAQGGFSQKFGQPDPREERE